MQGYSFKLARADEHLDAFYRATDGWGDGDPLAIDRESNADGSEHVFRLRFKAQPDLWQWAVLLGDAMHNLRCALDYIVYALAVAQTGKDPPDGYQHLTFPICGEPGGFQKSRWRIASLDQITQAAIEKTQPYNRLKPGKWFMPLVWLREIHNVDKHRFAHLTAVGSLPNEIATDARPGTYKALWNTAPALEGTPVFRLLLSEPNPDVRVDLNMTGAVILSAKGMDRPVSVYWITRHIRREVGLVCRYLSLFLPPE